MKTTFTLAFISWFFMMQAQEQLKLKFSIQNTSQVSSSVIIGRDYNATTGIDASLNEEDIYGTEMDALDIRSIQRTEEFHECLNSSIWNNSGNPLYFEKNMDMKIDIRNMDFTDTYNSCFELKIKAANYPLTLSIDALEWPTSSLHFFWISLYDNNCSEVKHIDLFNGEKTSLEIKESEIVERIIVKLNHEVSVNDNKLSLFEISPNPVSINGTINIKRSVPGKIEVFTINGRKIYETDNQSKIELSSAFMSSGIYIIKYSDNHANSEYQKLIIE